MWAWVSSLATACFEWFSVYVMLKVCGIHLPAFMLAASGTLRVLLAQMLQKGFEWPDVYALFHSKTGISYFKCSEKIYPEVYLHTVMSKSMQVSSLVLKKIMKFLPRIEEDGGVCEFQNVKIWLCIRSRVPYSLVQDCSLLYVLNILGHYEVSLCLLFFHFGWVATASLAYPSVQSAFAPS